MAISEVEAVGTQRQISAVVIPGKSPHELANDPPHPGPPRSEFGPELSIRDVRCHGKYQGHSGPGEAIAEKAKLTQFGHSLSGCSGDAHRIEIGSSTIILVGRRQA
jgi:hypothetical protein